MYLLVLNFFMSPFCFLNDTVIGFPGWVEPKTEIVGYSETNPVYLPLIDRNDDSRNGTTAKRGLGRVGIDDTGKLH